MVNVIKEQKLVDNHKRALIKYVFIADGSGQQANTLLVDVSMLRNALNTNNLLLNTASNANIRNTYSTTVKRIFGSIKSSGGYIKLQWDGANNEEIVAIGGGIFDYNFESMGDGATIRNPQAVTNGDILISTTGIAANDAATIFIDLRKDNRDYAAGQFDDPAAFNYKRGIL
jgi:hypothetical protein